MTLISRYPTISGIIAIFLDMTRPTKTSYESSRSLRRRATSHDGPRYPKIYPSQVVVRRRKAWCDRGLIYLPDFNNIYYIRVYLLLLLYERVIFSLW